VRFADRLRVEWDVDADAHDAIVPSLVVQPLVENAMRHAISASWNAGLVRISARRDGAALSVDVTDDGPGVVAARDPRPGVADLPAGAGVGLADTRARLTRLYGASSSLTLAERDGGGATASLRLPFHTSHAELG